MLRVYDDTYFMRQAIAQAKMAAESGEIPVGAIVVSNDRIIARGHNQTEILSDVTAHAEIISITAAANYLGDKYLHDCTLYVTLEPCPMCAGALAWSQISRVVYGAGEDKRGFMRFGRELLHPKTKLEFGVLQEECSQLMTDFFARRRR
ncbi:nucleoside deaminase [Lewinella sp. 4G2]|uniref:nucleoside deaminase n=1 Tax=Lewinella sp. 4G2 TaxID=1803372 RepID=UPI0007B4A7F5|nr:nucleoside deaminase [Lewinella sp. 4G2]OAV45960.1 tRNA-specific adenosine deaminase [Lewinella sp. 4G2]